MTVLGTGANGNGALINSNKGSAASDSANITEGPGGSFTIGGAGNLTLPGQVASTGNFTVTDVGAGTLTFSGSGNNAGLGLVVDAGTVVLDKASSASPDVHAVGAGGLTVNDGGTVQLSGTGDYQIYGAQARQSTPAASWTSTARTRRLAPAR